MWSDVLSVIGRILVFAFGVAIVVGTVLSAVRTFVLPRSANDPLTRAVFRMMRSLFDLRLRGARSYADRDRAMALYAPLGLLTLPPVWLTLVR